MNNFGGDWTSQKIDIIVSYAKAYLKVMKDQSYFKLIYFDGFAGSGEITAESKKNIEGAALRILSIEEPRTFDFIILWNLIKDLQLILRKLLKKSFPTKNIMLYLKTAI